MTRLVVPIGAPSPATLEFVSRVAVHDAPAKLQLDLPGEIVQVGRSQLLSIIPSAAVALGERRLMVSVAEKAKASTDAALAEVSLGRAHATTFAIRVSSPELTFAALFDPKRRRPLAVELRVVVGATGRKQPVVSPPFPGVLAGADDYGPGGEGSEGRHLFGCHSHWHAVLPFPPLYRYTYCHGSCDVAGKVCSCTAGKDVCEGWCFCTCN